MVKFFAIIIASGSAEKAEALPYMMVRYQFRTTTRVRVLLVRVLLVRVLTSFKERGLMGRTNSSADPATATATAADSGATTFPAEEHYLSPLSRFIPSIDCNHKYIDRLFIFSLSAQV